MHDNGELNEYQAQWFRESKPEEELFDTWQDPHELFNLAADPAYGEKLAELGKECDRWIEETGDMGLMNEHDYIESIWPGGIQPVTLDPVISQKGQHISLSCETDGASIGYQVLSQGQLPAESWTVYTESFDLDEGAQIVVVAHRIGYKPSNQVQSDE